MKLEKLFMGLPYMIRDGGEIYMGNSEKIFSNGNINRILLRFAIPSVISLLVIELYNMIDTVFVGRYIGGNAIAAITVAFPIQKFITSIGLLIAVGSSTYISRNLGENKPSEIKKSIINAFALIIILLILIPVFIYLIKEPLLYKLGASDVTYSMSDDYTSIILIGGMFQCLGLLICYTMTSLGNTRITLYSNSLGALVNTILNFILVAHFQIGIKGAAISTVISQIIVFAYSFYKFYCALKQFNINYSITSAYCSLNKDVINSIIAIGFSTFIVEISDAVVTIILNNLLYSSGGDTAIIIVGVVTKISMFMFTVIIGISSAMQPIVAYNYGAERFDKVKEIVITSIKTVTIISVVFAMIIGIFSNEIIGFFLKDKEILPEAVKSLRICISLLSLTGVYYIGIYYNQAIGEAKKGFLLSIFRQLVVFIPIAIILVEVFGTIGAWIAYPISDLISVLVSIILLNKAGKEGAESNVNLVHDESIA